jgi:RimJ/RimL family protein N-acetyltransferase
MTWSSLTNAARYLERVIRLKGAGVLLRPFRPSEFDRAWAAIRALDRRSQPFRPNLARFRRRFAASGRLERGFLDLAVEAGGRMIGEVQARRHPAQTLPPGVFEIGIILYDQADRGRGHGSEATRLLAAWLFDQAAAERVQATTSADNAPMRRALEKLGFALEGVMRSFMPNEDRRDDYAIYAMTRDRWAAGQPTRTDISGDQPERAAPAAARRRTRKA